ncbi:MAG: hypothetical protein HQL72_14925 [Magnetococcales bacterium]|nr:hypothetical protein [Magnetococcales bacterium]
MSGNLKIVTDGEGVPWCTEALDCLPKKGINFHVDARAGQVQSVHFSGGCINNPWSLRDLPNHTYRLTFQEKLSLAPLLRSIADRIERETQSQILQVKMLASE